MNRTDELRTARIESLVTPAELALRYPVTPGVATHVTDSRRRIEKILNGEDKRLLVIIGPCSIHDPKAAREYASRLVEVRHPSAVAAQPVPVTAGNRNAHLF